MNAVKLAFLVALCLLSLIDAVGVGFAGYTAFMDGLEQCPDGNRCNKANTMLIIYSMLLPVIAAACIFSIRAIMRVISSRMKAVSATTRQW
ncbi:hypothetical protein [Rhizobium lusitanum]|uniref:Uncharacterized protein n=1 Tax=Rhizobium lusitanum TaxID=293958 RepID=A0A7X0IQ67_9HYPH|nr:hypothetical protein [Rhizobium lusitanum]MBB6485030.1 hypothetical protein [Rhizobium lusitanum]